MKKPFYSKHNRKFCVSRILPNEYRPTKSDILRLIFKKFGIPIFAWNTLETRYKNKFNLAEIRKSFETIQNFSDFDLYGFLSSSSNKDSLLLDLYTIFTSKSFKEYINNFSSHLVWS